MWYIQFDDIYIYNLQLQKRENRSVGRCADLSGGADEQLHSGGTIGRGSISSPMPLIGDSHQCISLQQRPGSPLLSDIISDDNESITPRSSSSASIHHVYERPSLHNNSNGNNRIKLQKRLDDKHKTVVNFQFEKIISNYTLPPGAVATAAAEDKKITLKTSWLWTVATTQATLAIMWSLRPL